MKIQPITIMKPPRFYLKLFALLATFCATVMLTAQPAEPTKPDKRKATAPADKQAPDTMQVAVALTGYGFIPIDKYGSFSQLFPKADDHIEIKKSIHRLPFGEVTKWSGAKDILLSGGYHVTISAVYMEKIKLTLALRAR